MVAPLYVNAYSTDDGHAVLVDRSGGYGGPPRLERVAVEWQCFVDRASLPDAVYRELRTARAVRSILPDGRFHRVTWSDRVACRAGCEYLEEQGVATFEGNVDPLVRLMVERDVRPTRPRMLYVDIETD